MNSKRLVSMGKIVGAHGRAGAVKVFSYAQSPQVFNTDESVLVKSPQGDIQKWIIRWVKPHHRHLLVALQGVDNRDAASALKASEIFIHRDRLPQLEEGTYYWCDLIGMRVNNSGGERIGIIERIIATGANDVYVVKDGEKEILVPAIASVIEKIDLIERCMRVSLPDY